MSMAGHPKSRATTLLLATVMALAASGGRAVAQSLTGHASVAQNNAIRAAEEYLSDQAFSENGLIQQLSSPDGSGFSRALAVYAVAHVRVNWDTEAVEAAKNYLSDQAFSEKGLIQQLSSSAGSGFTEAQAVYALAHVKVNWNAEAVKAAKSYLSDSAFSCQGLIQQLSSSYGSGFTEAQAQYGAQKVGLC